MMYWYNGMGAAGIAFMTVGTLLFLGLLVAGVVALVHFISPRSPVDGAPSSSRLTPQQLLAERYARGEIDADEYTRGLQVLAGAAPSHRPAG